MKKKYTLPLGISNEISNTVDLVRNNIGTLNYKIIPISAIEFDPDNPRELAITRADLPDGPFQADPLYEKKMEEFESLKRTAETIKKYGVRNAVEIYKHENSYRLIHGERRCLSSILAGKKEIPAKILDEKPSDFDIRLLQMIENVQREDLTLYETLNNIRQVINEYKNHIDCAVVVDVPFLENLINRSKTHCLNFLVVLNAPEDFQEIIRKGEIRSLEKAAIIAKAKTKSQRDTLLKYCLNGASLKQLKQQSIQQKRLDNITSSFAFQPKRRPGKQASKINLGSTMSKDVIAKLIKLVSNDPLYSRFKEQFNQMSFDNYGACTSAFSSLIQIMERVEIN
jgi:ParB family transcriptional regulator, chromosome partitioning protein